MNVYISPRYQNEWTLKEGNTRPKPSGVVPLQWNNKGAKARMHYLRKYIVTLRSVASRNFYRLWFHEHILIHLWITGVWKKIRILALLGSIFLVSQSVSQTFWHRHNEKILTASKTLWHTLWHQKYGSFFYLEEVFSCSSKNFWVLCFGVWNQPNYFW